MKKHHAVVCIKSNEHVDIRIDVDISGITAHNAKKIFEIIGIECAPHLHMGARLISVYFYEEE